MLHEMHITYTVMLNTVYIVLQFIWQWLLLQKQSTVKIMAWTLVTRIIKRRSNNYFVTAYTCFST